MLRISGRTRLFLWARHSTDTSVCRQRSIQGRAKPPTSRPIEKRTLSGRDHGVHGETHGGRTAEEPDGRTDGGEARGREIGSRRAGDDSRGIRTVSATVGGGKVRRWIEVCQCGVVMGKARACAEGAAWGGVACLNGAFFPCAYACANDRALPVRGALFYASVQSTSALRTAAPLALGALCVSWLRQIVRGRF